MGGGDWTTSTYEAMTGAKIASGTAFTYDRTAKATGDYTIHPSLDPKGRNKAGENIREALDTDEHPLTTPIAVGFDSTGSMGSVPRVVQSKLKRLFGLLIDKRYCTDPQLAVATYGDSEYDNWGYTGRKGDRAPLQVGQFESDNRVDDALDNMILEGGGGGNGGETANLLLYYLAHHTRIDSYDKRGKKGHAFIIADEIMVPITADTVKLHIGDNQPLGDLTIEGIAADVTKKWNVHILLINNGTALRQGSEAFYTNLFGPDAVTIVQDPETIAETIAAIVGYDEGRDLDAITSDLTAAAGKEVALRVGQSLQRRAGATRLR